MDTVRVEAQVTPRDLLKAVKQLEPGDLEIFVGEVLKLQARQTVGNLTERETELMLQINTGLPEEARVRLDALREKHQAETSTPEEREEYLGLLTQVEELQSRRLEALSELARLRKTTLRTMMRRLDIASPGYA